MANVDFALREREELGDGLRRIAQEQIDFAAGQLDARAADDGGDPVHEARKSFKRMRAIVRLARDELGDETYRRENTAFRDLGRRLSSARDAQVLVLTLDALREADGAAVADGLEPLRAALAAAHADAEARLAGDDATVAAALGELDSARGRVAAWIVPHHDVQALAPGLRRIYARGRKAYRAASGDPTDEHLHELRKRAKDLWHAAQIVEHHRPKRMKKLAKAAHQLSDYAGDDHDLAVLAQAAAGHGPLVDPGTLQPLIDARRKRLRKNALRAAKKIYKAKPRAFVNATLG